jgi:hypothetical protein
MPRYQINGKTNNVTFITLPDRIEIWKNAVLHYFGVKKTYSFKRRQSWNFNGVLVSLDTAIFITDLRE